MRIRLDLDERLLAAARRRAAAQGTTLTAFVEASLAAALSPRTTTRQAYRLRWKTHRGRLLPGVDVADRDRLLDVLDGRR